jgi:Zn-dependent peptidase ImmA (M78 family)
MASQLVYGFKARAERIAEGIRRQLGLRAGDRFEAASLADRLGIPVTPLADLTEFGASIESIARLSSDGAGFSAMTVFVERARLIVYNEQHPPGRRANSLSHELSHLILEHPPTPALFHEGQRLWNARMEEEADWLAAALLVPRDGALEWLRDGGTIVDGAEHFGVSRPLFQWRVNQTGIIRQLQAIAHRR